MLSIRDILEKKKDVKRLKIKATDRTTKYEDNKF